MRQLSHTAVTKSPRQECDEAARLRRISDDIAISEEAMKRIALAALAVVLVLAAGAVALRAESAGAAAADPAGTLSVQGTATVSTIPDRAQISFGVESQAATARAALAANATEMRRVIAALKSAGAADIRTQSVWLSSRYGNDNVVVGYVAQNTVSATVEDVARAGATIDAAVEAGANQIYGPSLSTTDQAELYRQALKAAVADARARAEALALAAGATIGRATQIAESGATPGPLPYAAAEKAAADSTPIEGGKQEVSATVTVTFALS
jgi:uncharacterized protein